MSIEWRTEALRATGGGGRRLVIVRMRFDERAERLDLFLQQRDPLFQGRILGRQPIHRTVAGGMLRDDHPGFAPRALAYGAAADRWTALAAPPVNQLATPAVPVADGFILVSGEVKPRHRSPAAWRVSIDTDALPVP